MGQDSNTAASGSAIRVEACRVLSMFGAAVLAPHASPWLVNWNAAVADTNRNYATWLWYENENHQVRGEDLTHFTHEGADRAATWTTAALVDLFAKRPPRSDAATGAELPPRADRGRRPGDASEPTRALTAPTCGQACGRRHGRRSRRSPNPTRTAPPMVSLTATIQSVTSRPV